MLGLSSCSVCWQQSWLLTGKRVVRSDLLQASSDCLFLLFWCLWLCISQAAGPSCHANGRISRWHEVHGLTPSCFAKGCPFHASKRSSIRLVDVGGAYHDALDLALFPELAHDALQLSLPLLRQLLAAEVVPGLVQQLRWLCWHLLQRVLLQLTLCEDCSTSEMITQPGLALQGLQCTCCMASICSAY